MTSKLFDSKSHLTLEKNVFILLEYVIYNDLPLQTIIYCKEDRYFIVFFL
jgi:hypothetical protein